MPPDESFKEVVEAFARMLLSGVLLIVTVWALWTLAVFLFSITFT